MSAEKRDGYSIIPPLLFCFVLLGFVAYYVYTVITGEQPLHPIEAVLAATTACASILCIMLLFQMRGLYRATGRAPGRRGTSGRNVSVEMLLARNEENLRKLKTLANQVEILSAMREMSLLASQDVDFERLVEHALQLVEQVIGTREITLFLRSGEDTKVLRARARRIEGQTYFAGAIDPGWAGLLGAAASLGGQDTADRVGHEDVLEPPVSRGLIEKVE